MAEDEVKIKVSADGVTETAEQMDKLTASMQRQQRTAEMIAKTSTDIKRQAVIDAIKKEAAAVNEVTAALQKQKTAATGAIEGASSGISTLRSRLGPTTALLGTFGSALASLAPQASGAVGALQKVSGAFGQVLAFSGSGGAVAGPYGAIAGGIVGLFAGIASAMGAAKQEADDLAKATAANAKAMGDYVDQIGRLRASVGGKFDQRKGEGDLRTKLLAGDAGSEDDIQKEILTQQARLDNKYYGNAYMGKDAAGNRISEAEVARRQNQAQGIRDYIAELARAKAQAGMQDVGAAQNARDKFDVDAEVTAAGGLPDGKKKATELPPLTDTQQFLMGQSPEFGQNQIDRQKGIDDAAQKAYDTATARRKSDYEMRIADEASFQSALSDAIQAGADQQVQIAEEKKRAEDQLLQAQVQAERQAQQMIAGAALKSISEVLKGKKLEAGAILEGLGDQFVAAGTGLIFTGLGISANPFTPGAGAGMVAIGGAEVAFGLGLGAAGARMPGGSSASGGGAGPKPGYEAATPYKNTFTPDEQKGPTYINVTMPTVLSPSPEDGVRIREALRQAGNVYGR